MSNRSSVTLTGMIANTIEDHVGYAMDVDGARAEQDYRDAANEILELLCDSQNLVLFWQHCAGANGLT